MRRDGRRTGVAAVLSLLTACASGKAAGPAASPVPQVVAAPAPAKAPASAGSAGTSAAPRQRQDQQLITRDVILGTQYNTLYEVIQAMRSNWLRVRTSSSATGKGDVLQVYLDNQRIGGVDELRRIVPSSVLSARYFDPIAASARWGLDHGAGAIYVLTAK